MLESVLFNRRVMQLALMKIEALVPDAAKKVDWEFVQAVLAVLKPFAEATRTMEAEKHPTIGLVLGVVALLRKQMDGLLKHENAAIRAVARNMSIEFDRRWVGINSSPDGVVCSMHSGRDRFISVFCLQVVFAAMRSDCFFRSVKLFL